VDGAAVEIYHPEIGTASMTMSLGSKPKLLFLYRWFAVLMGVASMVAALPVAALSFGCHGAVLLLARVRPLRDGYEFLSRMYDRMLHRLGQKVLRDGRDTPALRVMVSLTLTVVPISRYNSFWGGPAVAGGRFLSFSLRSQVPAVCEDVQRESRGGAPEPRLLFWEIR